MFRTLAYNVFLALIYGLTGWLALQVAVPPGYAAPLFPPAGIALAALLTHGYGLTPGVLLGSLGVQFMAAAQAGFSGFSWSQALLAALGPTLQALAGTWLTRRLTEPPRGFESTRDILLLVGLVAPMSCLIAASLSVPRLVESGVIQPGDAVFSWWNWWIGDTLGVITVTPLVLALIGQPRKVWAPRLRTVALPLAAALLLVAGLFVQMREWERLRVEAQFARDAESIGSLLTKRLDVQVDMVLALERLISVSEKVTAEEWREFVRPWLGRHSGTLNFAWAPLVPHARRAAFEAAGRSPDVPAFRILDRSIDGRTFPATEATEYLAYLYVEPLAGNLQALGLNPLSLEISREAVERTRRDGRPAATAGLRLVQDAGQQRSVVVYQAVFARGPGEARGALRGVVSTAFRMDETIAATLAGLHSTGMDICIIDLTSRPEDRRLFGPDGCEHPDWSGPRQHVALPYTFGGRSWHLLLRASDAYRAANRSWAVWSILAVGLTCAGLLGAFLLVNSGRTRRITELVVERTAELAAASDHLRVQREALAEAQRMARMGSWTLLDDGEGIECSEELRRVMGLPEEHAITLTALSERISAEDRARLFTAMEQARLRAGVRAIDCRLADADGSHEVLHFQIESSGTADQPRLRGTVQNVTAARQAEAHIHFLARFDSLTGLPNRVHWLEHARATVVEAHRHGDPVAVLFLDLDHFKTVNDSLGHPVGDRLLSAVVDRFTHCLREADLLARLGGDEFVVLISRFHTREDVARVAAKLIDSLLSPIAVDHYELSVSVSIGIALYPDDGADVDTLLKHADVAMYGAKQAGRNAFHFFEPHMNVQAVRRLELEHALRRGIERQELILHYQPQLDLATGRPCSCEALVRWQHPERGLVPPDQFIPIAEESGLILPMGDWVLAEACRQQARLAAQGVVLVVAVNISALQFRRPDFADRVARILEESGADPAYIELEITESTLMQPDEAMLERLGRIRGQGITLALDDFGTGYSSLAYLRRLPIQRLKIDRSFVRDLPGDPEDAAIASATLSLARDLGLAVVAEGVETAEQRDYLAARGCDLIQGYLVARPMPMDDLLAWLEERRDEAFHGPRRSGLLPRASQA
jgi:diguanylate cyclase (GGDEF)-like protein